MRLLSSSRFLTDTIVHVIDIYYVKWSGFSEIYVNSVWYKTCSIESGLAIASKSQLIEKYFNCCPKALRKCFPELFRIINEITWL